MRIKNILTSMFVLSFLSGFLAAQSHPNLTRTSLPGGGKPDPKTAVNLQLPPMPPKYEGPLNKQGETVSVYVPEYGITVETSLADPRNLTFKTENDRLQKSRELYFALGRLGESKKDFRPFYQRYSLHIFFTIFSFLVLALLIVVFNDAMVKLKNRSKLYIKKKTGSSVSIEDIDSVLNGNNSSYDDDDDDDDDD